MASGKPLPIWSVREHVVKALRNALDEGRLHHAYLLTGTRGGGKTTIAGILAKSLNCENAVYGEPCGQCESCTQIDSGRYVDLLEIDAASNTGIDNIREVLKTRNTRRLRVNTKSISSTKCICFPKARSMPC